VIVGRILDSVTRIERLRSVLGAADLKWLSGYLSTKTPETRALWWHQDWWCWDHPVSFIRSASQAGVLCYLGNTSEKNGALRVLAGSHHESSQIHGQLPVPHAHEADELALDHPAMTDLPDQTTVSVIAGDAVVLDYRLLHGTHPNSSEDRRDCVLLSFLPNWRGLPSEIKAHLVMHPALPDESELPSVLGNLANLVPQFDGVPKSLAVNRSAPKHFKAH
jgi:ectoine hydroxylase-related dioxygenase (phytanoyl-CoA dioxygenase family)